jgi:hypothetical protein
LDRFRHIIQRRRAADSLLRKIQEDLPDFQVRERERHQYVSFVVRSSNGLRHAKKITGLIAFVSVIASVLSLAALVWAAVNPKQEISTSVLMVFVFFTLIGAPINPRRGETASVVGRFLVPLVLPIAHR